MLALNQEICTECRLTSNALPRKLMATGKFYQRLIYSQWILVSKKTIKYIALHTPVSEGTGVRGLTWGLVTTNLWRSKTRQENPQLSLRWASLWNIFSFSSLTLLVGFNPKVRGYQASHQPADASTLWNWCVQCNVLYSFLKLKFIDCKLTVNRIHLQRPRTLLFGCYKWLASAELTWITTQRVLRNDLEAITNNGAAEGADPVMERQWCYAKACFHRFCVCQWAQLLSNYQTKLSKDVK